VHPAPVVMENHADHTYWLGLGGTEVISDFRLAGQMLTRRLRGAREERLGLLPLPVEEIPGVSGEAVRQALRLGRDDVVALTVADEGKLAPLWGRSYADVLQPVLAAFPRLKVVVVGPPRTGGWQVLADRFEGRLFPVGRVEDPDPWYAAADLYLNSYPITSGTSVLEAAAAGLPVVTLRDFDDREGFGAVFQGESPGLTGVQHLVTNDDQLHARLRRLLRDPAVRTASGASARAAVLRTHAGPGWSTTLEGLYEQARSAPPADIDEYPRRVEAPRYGAVLLPLVAPTDRTRDVAEATAPLGEQVDATLAYDLFAASNRDAGSSLQVRIGQGWEDHPTWTRRLLALAQNHPRLSVSLPFVLGDDAAATRSVEVLTDLLALDGQTTDDCGEISLDAEPPTPSGPAITGELERTPEALDRLEAVLSSPCWDEPPAGIAIPSRQPVLVG
jgi:hypothetical protein